MTILPWIVSNLVLLRSLVGAYYIGENIDTAIYSYSGKTEAGKALTPKFGIDSAVSFPNRGNEHFSIGFEEGFHRLPWFDLNDLGSIQVTFVFSTSGYGAIRTVSCEPVLKTSHDKYSGHQLDVNYIWVDENPVDPTSGAILMFLSTLVLSIALLVRICGLFDYNYVTCHSPNIIMSSHRE